MPDRQQVARSAATGIRNFSTSPQLPPVTLGFDGFIDSILAVVDKRHSADLYDPVPTIERFGNKILEAAGKSANYELALKLRKLGGNGPIMANALCSLSLPVTYIGALGHPTPDPIFQPLTSRAKCFSICDPGLTDALEFSDGKLMLGKHDSIRDVSPQRIDQVVGRQNFASIIHQSSLLAMLNWTMLVNMNSIWQLLIDEVLPGAGAGAKSPKRLLIFIDLADPEKRTPADLLQALNLLTKMQKHADVTLGLNQKESTQIAQVLRVDPTSGGIREKLQLDTILIHDRKSCSAATQSTSSSFLGPFTPTPKLSTGAGDNFNAGFCLARLANLPLDQSLAVATATSGYYVRNAASPTLPQLADFCDNLPDPE